MLPNHQSGSHRRDFAHARVAAFGVALLVGALMAACAPAAPPPTAAPPPKPTEAPKPAAKATEAPAAKPAAPAAKPAEKPAAPAAKPAEKPAAVASPAAKPAAQPAAKADWQAEWDKTVAAAKQEGKVHISGPPLQPLRDMIMKFREKYPEIPVDYIGGGGGRDHNPRILAERGAGQYLTDVLVGGAGSAFRQLKPAGVLDPLKPALILPEVLEDRYWVNGFDFGFQDVEKRFSYCFEGTVKPAIWVNRDFVPDSQLSKLDQLLEPQWKGKIATDDPRAAGPGVSDAGHLIAVRSEDWLKRFWAQDIRLTSDRRQLPEWVVRGTFPIGTGLVGGDFKPFLDQNLGKNIKGVEMEAGGARPTSSWGCLGLINRAPHPNAAKVFLNWFLSKDAQTLWQPADEGASRRTDLPPPPGGVETKMTPAVKWTDDELNKDAQDKADKLSKEIFK